MDTLSEIAPLASIWLAAHFAMGPDFVVTARMGITQPRQVALLTVVGITIGTAIWAIAGYYGINALFAAAPWLFSALKLCGGTYLIYLGVGLLRGSIAPGETDDSATLHMSSQTAFRLGLLTNVANPKAALFTASVFAATIPPEPSALFGPAAIIVMVLISFCFYGGVAFTLTTRRVALAFAKAGKWFDRVAGTIFIGIGAKFMFKD
jgi:threonine/homoserine/homoserine lactone efflux protein